MKNLFCILLFISLSACVSGNKKTSTAKTNTNNEAVDLSQLSQISTLKFKSKESCKAPISTYSWKKLVNISNSCLHKKNYDTLIKVANFLSTHHSNLPFGPYFKSFYFSNKNLNLKALWLIDSAIEKENNVGIFHYQKSIILSKLKYTGAAKGAAQTAVELEPNNFGAQLLLGQLELQAGNNKQALEHTLKAKKINKNNKNVDTLLADLYFVTRDYENAIKYLKGINKSNAIKNEVNFKLAYSFEKLENKEQSIYFYKKIEAVKKSNLLSVYGLDVNDKIKEMEVEVAKLETKVRQPSNKEVKKKDSK